jgi:1,4-dihydroxy-2-naphthoate octaprenyltransferase
MLREPLAASWAEAIALLLAIAAGAVFVSLLNDVTDIEEDARAGKPNRIAGRAAPFRVLALSAPVAIGILFLVLWRDEPLLAGAYLAAWIAFTLYSVPPFRLKVRGLAGVLADACGAHLFPTLVAMLAAFRAAERPVDPLWIAAGSAWALGYGVRGILWHQLSDRANDRAAGVRTFAERHSPRLAVNTGLWAAWPLEAAGLAFLVWRSGTLLTLWFLAGYLLLVLWRIRSWKMTAVIVAPRPDYLILMHEYYDVFLPLSLLIASSARHPQDLWVLAAFLALFPRRPLHTLQDMGKLIRLFYWDMRYPNR